MPAGGQKATVKNEEAVPSMRQETRGVDPYNHEQEQSANFCQLSVIANIQMLKGEKINPVARDGSA